MDSCSKIISFNGLKFSYEEKHIEQIDLNEQVVIYSKIIILESNNNKFITGTKIDQISIASHIYFEHDDGTPY